MTAPDKPVEETDTTPEANTTDTVVDEQPSSQTKDTFSRAADWLRRLGKISDEAEPEAPRQSATIGETVQAAREQAQSRPQMGDETIALPIFGGDFLPEEAPAPRPSSRNQRRFVLKVNTGQQVTIGETPGGIGSAVDHPAPGDGPWQWVQLPDEESIDPVHVFFGSENGVLWISDKGSAFGTIVVEPGQAPIQCEPERRYFVIRGSEIRLGGLIVTVH